MEGFPFVTPALALALVAIFSVALGATGSPLNLRVKALLEKTMTQSLYGPVWFC